MESDPNSSPALCVDQERRAAVRAGPAPRAPRLCEGPYCAGQPDPGTTGGVWPDHSPALWWPSWGMRRTFKVVARWRPGWAWCPASTPAAASKTCWASVSAGTRISRALLIHGARSVVYRAGQKSEPNKTCARVTRSTQSAQDRSRRQPANPIRDSGQKPHQKSECTGAIFTFEPS